jgi:VIT1/CCC1 family predicted Fe2+/Mn2+ transporter
LGGFIPLLPYMFIAEAKLALYVSAGVTLFTLLIFGYLKAKWMGMKKEFSSAIQMMLVGGAAAFAAFGLTHYLTKN